MLGALKRLGYRGRMTGHGFRALAMSTIKEKLGYRLCGTQADAVTLKLRFRSTYIEAGNRTDFAMLIRLLRALKSRAWTA